MLNHNIFFLLNSDDRVHKTADISEALQNTSDSYYALCTIPHLWCVGYGVRSTLCKFLGLSETPDITDSKLINVFNEHNYVYWEVYPTTENVHKAYKTRPKGNFIQVMLNNSNFIELKQENMPSFNTPKLLKTDLKNITQCELDNLLIEHNIKDLHELSQATSLPFGKLKAIYELGIYCCVENIKQNIKL